MSNHPTGIAGALASVLIIIATQLGLDLNAEQAAAVVGAIAAVVSYFTPRDNTLTVIKFSPEGSE